MGLGNEDREYELCDGTKPISCSIPSKHSKIPTVHNKKRERNTYSTLRYKSTFFIEKQSTEPGSVNIGDYIWYGRLKVSADNINLQSFYSYILTKMYCLKNTIRKRNLLKR
jgi:hypothetical protein